MTISSREQIEEIWPELSFDTAHFIATRCVLRSLPACSLLRRKSLDEHVPPALRGTIAVAVTSKNPFPSRATNEEIAIALPDISGDATRNTLFGY